LGYENEFQSERYAKHGKQFNPLEINEKISI